MRWLLTAGILFTVMGLLAVMVEEGWNGIRHPLNLVGAPKSSEPIKRAGFHLLVLGGLAMLVLWCTATIVSLVL